MDQCNYRVEFAEFTARHFRKTFQKKYKSAWAKTEADIVAVCERIDNMLLYNRADLISTHETYKLVKLDFAVDGSRISPKASGNRCILFIDEKMRLVRILLIYSKNDIPSHNETKEWQKIIKAEYPQIAQIFSL